MTNWEGKYHKSYTGEGTDDGEDCKEVKITLESIGEVRILVVLILPSNPEASVYRLSAEGVQDREKALTVRMSLRTVELGRYTSHGTTRAE